jgi:hypothetical protein
MTYLLFAVALSLSAVAAWYAVAGLVAIFAAAAVPIVIMGSLLEVAKLTVASWLYRSWKEIPFLMKSYFTIALVVLMLLTSMGIFGFLSKAHLDQAIPVGDVAAKLALIDEKIQTEKDNINDARKTISQLDRQVDETISRTANQDNNAGVNRSINIRRSQQKERANLLNEIGASQTKIAALNEERAPIATEVRKVEAEVGPIKYIAAVIYGDSADTDTLERAVRIVTILIVVVFDPLAVLMLVAANWQLRRDKQGVIEPVSPNVWDSFFKKKGIDIDDKVNVDEEIKVAKVDGMNYEQTFKEAEETELPEIKIEEHSKDWEPELYDRVQKRIEYDSAGRRITPETEEEIVQKNNPSKTQSFLNKVSDVFQSTGVKTIEREVAELQKDPKK